MAAAHTARDAPSRPPLSWPGVVLGWFGVGEQATGGSRGGHSGLSNSVTRANRRQQQGIGCTSTCQRINADTHSTTTRPLSTTLNHSQPLYAPLLRVARNRHSATRRRWSRPVRDPAARSRLSSLTTTSLLLLRWKPRGEKLLADTADKQTANSPGRGEGEGGSGGRGEGRGARSRVLSCCSSSSSGAQAARPKKSRPLTAGPSVSPMVSSQCLKARPA